MNTVRQTPTLLLRLLLPREIEYMSQGDNRDRSKFYRDPESRSKNRPALIYPKLNYISENAHSKPFFKRKQTFTVVSFDKKGRYTIGKENNLTSSTSASSSQIL